MFGDRGSGNKAQRQPAFAQGYGGRAGTEAQSKKDKQATEFHGNHRIPKIARK
jgi:hypothetical protein